MAVGDQKDISRRLRALIPASWFKEPTPLIDAGLAGFAGLFTTLYALIVYSKKQTRLASTSDGFLDLAAYDFLGFAIQRKPKETDASFLSRIRKEILRQRVTRAGMVSAIADLTGHTPVILEPWNPNDTGGWGQKNLGYGAAGRWGSRKLPAQVFMNVTRGNNSGVPKVGGWGSPISAYGGGQWEWIGPEITGVGITDADIFQTIELTKPTGVIVWVMFGGARAGTSAFTTGFGPGFG